MKKIITLILLLPIVSFAQIGINTAAPNAALDIQSTDNGLLIPRVQLTDALDVASVVNPAGGALANATLVYNLAPSGVAPNNVLSGFYYWNGSRWTSIASSAVDHDWYEVGGTTAPNAITDNMFHTGNVAIGKNTANTTLDVETNDQNIGITNVFRKNIAGGAGRAIDNTLVVNSIDDVSGIRTSFWGTGTGLKIGIQNICGAATPGTKIGIDNNFSAAGSTYMSGIVNTLNHTGGGETLGVVNYITHPVGATGTSHGFENRIDNNGLFETTGLYNVISSTTGGSGGSYGSMNFIGGRKGGGKVGALNVLTTDIAVPDMLMGTQNYMTANTDVPGLPSTMYGAFNRMETNGNNWAIGTHTNIYGSGSGDMEGENFYISISGNGVHTGSKIELTGIGSGTKYGIQNVIDPFAGGTHYGIHSTVLKPGANNFAGYFLGNVGIGTTTTNTYTFPASRGTNGQIMQTNAAGVVTWQNPNAFSWSLTGNTVNAATHFLGSTNNADVAFRRNNTNAGFIGQFNTAMGISALPATTGIYNTAFGVNALSGLGAADQNCAFGWNALSNVTTGGNNIGIGTGAQVPTAAGNNQIRLGNVNIGYAGIQVPWSITSDRRWKSDIQKSNLGLDFINHLNPVSYLRKNDASNKTEYGFIAQELEQTLAEFGTSNSGIITKDDAGFLSVRYNDLLAPMVKAIQELKTENEDLIQKNQALEKRLQAIEEKLNRP